MVAIVPDEVELLNVVDYQNPIRIEWNFVPDHEKGDSGGDEFRGRWEEVEVWP